MASIKHIQNTILLELYKINAFDKFYILQDLLKDFGVEEITKQRLLDISRSLKDKKYIQIRGDTDRIGARLLPAGTEYVEETLLNLIYDPQDKFTEEEKGKIQKKLDELRIEIERLRKGQEIIYDDISQEFEELKVLLSVLGKKNFNQILNGKLIDLGLGQISNAVFKIIEQIFKENKLLEN